MYIRGYGHWQLGVAKPMDFVVSRTPILFHPELGYIWQLATIHPILLWLVTGTWLEHDWNIGLVWGQWWLMMVNNG